MDTMTITFEARRKDGKICARRSGEMIYPEGKQPRAGETWECQAERLYQAKERRYFWRAVLVKRIAATPAELQALHKEQGAQDFIARLKANNNCIMLNLWNMAEVDPASVRGSGSVYSANSLHFDVIRAIRSEEARYDIYQTALHGALMPDGSVSVECGNGRRVIALLKA